MYALALQPEHTEQQCVGRLTSGYVAAFLAASQTKHLRFIVLVFITLVQMTQL